MEIKDLTPGAKIKGRYTSTVRTVESVDSEHVTVSWFNRRGWREFDRLRLCDVLAYWELDDGVRKYRRLP